MVRQVQCLWESGGEEQWGAAGEPEKAIEKARGKIESKNWIRSIPSPNRDVPLQNISLFDVRSGRDGIEDLLGNRRDVTGLGGVFSQDNGATSHDGVENRHFVSFLQCRERALHENCKLQDLCYPMRPRKRHWRGRVCKDDSNQTEGHKGVHFVCLPPFFFFFFPFFNFR